MINIGLTDSELIYYIKQNKEEAFKLLFLRYKTKMRKIINKYGLNTVYERDGDFLEGVYFDALNEAVNYYSCDRGVFYSYFCGMYKNKIYGAISKKKCYMYNEIPCPTIEEMLSDTHNYCFNEEASRCLKLLLSFDERCYQIITYCMQGLSYEEIAKVMNITVKVVAYLLRRGMKYLKNRLL